MIKRRLYYLRVKNRSYLNNKTGMNSSESGGKKH